MYSVIIQTKETMEEFSTYRPLFMEALNNNTVGFCTWNDQEVQIDDALPGIRELTDDKKEWHAIIVRLRNEKQSVSSSISAQNPYDYFRYDNIENELEESQIPLIRLTHMLGGIPPIEKEFNSILIEEEHLEPRVVYEPVEDREREESFRKLQDKYEFDGILPSSIVIITIREPWHSTEDTSKEWIHRHESQSSEFWRRNRYPSICRFVVFDVQKQGPVKREEDLFRFWLTVLLLATNKIDSASLQAYRLYRADTFVNADVMSDVFQQTVNRLASVKSSIKLAINREIRGIINIGETLPDYRIDIPVVFDIPKNTKCTVKASHFNLVSSSPVADINIWNEEKKQAEDSLIRSVRIADRALDQTANRMKDSYTYDEDAVVRLDKYQKEDLVQETDLLYRDIIDLQGKLPTSNVTSDDSTEEISKEVRLYLRGRVTAKPILYTFLFGLLTAVLMQIPTIFEYFKGREISWPLVLGEVFSVVVVMAVCGGITLLFQKRHLTELVEEFNKKMKGAFSKLQTNAKEYSQYLTAVASHSRGRSYISQAEKKEQNDTNIRSMQYKHIGAINLFLSRMQVWSKAFHLDVDYKKPVIYDGVNTDIMVPPTESILYSFENGQKCDVEMNKSGMKITSPYTFINKFELVREELYDDDI